VLEYRARKQWLIWACCQFLKMMLELNRRFNKASIKRLYGLIQ
jgi:hypothetical protein